MVACEWKVKYRFPADRLTMNDSNQNLVRQMTREGMELTVDGDALGVDYGSFEGWWPCLDNRRYRVGG